MDEIGRNVDVECESGITAHLDGETGVVCCGAVAGEGARSVRSGDRTVEGKRHHVRTVACGIRHERRRVGTTDSEERRGKRKVGVRHDDVVETVCGNRSYAVIDGAVQPAFHGPERSGAVPLRPLADLFVVAHDEDRELARGVEHAVGERLRQVATLFGRQHLGKALFGSSERLHGHEDGGVHRAECRKRDTSADRSEGAAPDRSIVRGYGRMMVQKGIHVGVIGAGSWGTTVAAMTSANAATTLWARRESLAEEINDSHTNADYLPEFSLPEALEATSDLERIVSGSDVIVMAVPSHGYREVARQVAEHLRPWVPVVTLAKGLERETLRRMSQVTEEEMPGHPVAVLTGPNLAKEIIGGQPAASVVAIDDQRIAHELQQLFSRPSLRVYTNPDVVGCEVAGVVKNVIAISSGMAQGMGFGDNTRATLITRGLAEMTRLGEELGGETATFAGLAGMGDLIATCSSTQSRNNTVGRRLGEGESIDDIVSSMNMVAEGVKSCPSVLQLASEHGVEMPIAEQVVAVCHDGRSAKEALAALMDRDVKSEHD